MSYNRRWTLPTDMGPSASPRIPRLTKRGIGGVKAILGNPVSFTVDPILGCLPWVTLKGGQDSNSQRARQDLLALESQGDSSAGTIANNTPAPANTTTPGTDPTPSRVVNASGPFAYIKASLTGR
jgi:hypothetical protein